MKHITIVVLGTVVMSTTACSGLVGESLFTSNDEGRFLLSADSEGLQSFGNALNGLVTTGKASPDTRDAYWANQDERLKSKVIRFQPKIIKGGRK